MEITKREVIASIAIIAVSLTIGSVLHGKITDYQNDMDAEYQKAVHITDPELFRYGMETNVGNAFVYGELQAVDPVTFGEAGGEYLYIKRAEEWYERHEKEVEVEDDDGNKHKEVEVYYEWDTKEVEERHAEAVRFCGVDFPYGKIRLPGARYIDTIHGDREYSMQSGEYVETRSTYYGVEPGHTGTLYTRLSDGTITDGSRFFDGYTIDQALEECTSGGGGVAFWIAWIMLTGFVVYGFCYLDNRWLED